MVAWAVPAAIAGGQMAAGYLGNEAARGESRRAMKDAANQRAAAQGYLDQINPEELAALEDLYIQSLRPTISEDTRYRPEQYQYIEAPEYMKYTDLGDVKANLISEDPALRDAQLAALTDLQTRAEEGLDAKSAAQFMRARQDAGEFARGREGAIINNLQARGMGGSGIEAAMRQMAGQQGADRLAQTMSDEAAAAADMRLQAELAALNAAGDIRGQDFNRESSNADILNNFAMANSARRQQIANMNTDLGNKRIDSNTGEQRRVSGLNTGTRNDAQLKNIDLERMRNESLNQNLMTKYGAGQDVYNAKADKAGMQSDAALGGLKETYAKGAAEADYQRNKYGSIGQGLDTFGDWYMYDQANKDKK